MRQRRSLAGEWLEKASHDLDAAVREFRSRGWTDVICFHCQQTAEKALKGFLVSESVDLTRYRTHDLSRLLESAAVRDPRLRVLRTACEQLTPFYIEARYPLGEPVLYSRHEAGQAIAAARRVLSIVEGRLAAGRRESRSD